MRHFILLFIISSVLIVSCKKWEDKPGMADERLNRHYCNDPLAVNYNWDFPGTPDQTLCFYPTDVFEGTYNLKSKRYYSDEFKFQDSTETTFTLVRKSSNKFELVGFFCDSAASITIPFTADRFYKATVDSVMLADSILLGGQPLCRPKDTLSGFIMRSKESATITINFRIGTDTNAIFYLGTAQKQ